MKKILLTIVFSLFGLFSIRSAKAISPFYRVFTPTSSTGMSTEVSGSVESVKTIGSVWEMTAGGVSADTHYARVKYKIPENAATTFTKFYMKAEIVLPNDFYTKQVAGFRIMNTDNYGTTLNGTHIGTTGEDIFTSIYFWSDHSLRVQSSYGNVIKNFYTMPTRLPVGAHTLELSGDIANVAPWYLRIDGVVVASGTARLSPDETPASERTITRMVAGIDGGAGFSSNSVTVQIKSFTIAEYDPTTTSPTTTPTPTAGPKPGDANDNNIVDESDFGIWKNSYLNAPNSSTYSLGDFDNNNKVDGLDYMIWAINYGK